MLSAIIISLDEKFRDNTRKLLEGSDLIEVRTELNNFNSALDSWRSNEIKNMESAIIIVDVTPGFKRFRKLSSSISIATSSWLETGPIGIWFFAVCALVPRNSCLPRSKASSCFRQ
jgi:hypothetical protein